MVFFLLLKRIYIKSKAVILNNLIFFVFNEWIIENKRVILFVFVSMRLMLKVLSWELFLSGSVPEY